MQFFDVKQSKIRWMVVEIKFIKGKNSFKNLESENQKFGPKKSGKIHKNREKNLQFNGIKQSKIQWMVVEIKFMKGENFKQKIKKMA